AGPAGLSGVVDADDRRTGIRGLSKTDTATYCREFISRVQTYASQRFRDLPVTVGIAGGTIGVQTAMNDIVVHDKIVNIFQISTIIFLLSALVFRSLSARALVLTPLPLVVGVH